MSAPTQEDVLFGKIAIKNRLASEAQVRECIALLEKSNGDDLGKVLLKKGYISQAQYQAISNHLKGLREKNGKEGREAAVAEPPAERPARKAEVFTPADVAKMSFK